VNPGIYTIISEQLVLGLVIGLLSITTPSIVGASVFSASKWIMAIICFLGAGVQVLGFLAVQKRNMSLFKRYVSMHGIVLVAALAIGATWTVISGVRHNDAKTNCIKEFFNDTEGDLKSQGETLCNVFAYVDVGIMGGLLVLFLIAQSYLYVLMLAYPASMNARSAGTGVDNQEKPFPDTIPMYNTRSNSAVPANPAKPEYSHLRRDSDTSMHDIMNEPVQTGRDGFSQRSYDADSYYPARPKYTYTEEPGPMPGYNPYSGEAPSAFQNQGVDGKYHHPGEGSFSRKASRAEQNPYV
jgi:hypothetical protein